MKVDSIRKDETTSLEQNWSSGATGEAGEKYNTKKIWGESWVLPEVGYKAKEGNSFQVREGDPGEGQFY